MKKIIQLIGHTLLLLNTACTFSVTTVHTQGQAYDVVDETNTPSTSLSLPVSVLPKPTL